MVFQGAMNALNPVITVRAQLRDTLMAHRPGLSRAKVRERSEEVLRARRGRPATVGVLPARAVRRHAPASHDRHGDAARTAGHDHGRAHHGSGRRRPTRDPPRDHAAARRARTSPSSSSRTTCRCYWRSATASPSCWRGEIVELGAADLLYRARAASVHPQAPRLVPEPVRSARARSSGPASTRPPYRPTAPPRSEHDPRPRDRPRQGLPDSVRACVAPGCAPSTTSAST